MGLFTGRAAPWAARSVAVLSALLVCACSSPGVAAWGVIGMTSYSVAGAGVAVEAGQPAVGGAVPGRPGDAAAACACGAGPALPPASEHSAVIEELLAGLEAAKAQNFELRERLLRAKHHRPVLLVNPLGGPRNTVWQLGAALAAVLCASALMTEGKNRRRLQQLRAAAHDKEATWRRCVHFLGRAAKQVRLPDAEQNGGRDCRKPHGISMRLQ
jgi:hypothetical protein